MRAGTAPSSNSTTLSSCLQREGQCSGLGEGKLPHPLTKQQGLEIQSALLNHHGAYLMLEQWLLSHWNSRFFS